MLLLVFAWAAQRESCLSLCVWCCRCCPAPAVVGVWKSWNVSTHPSLCPQPHSSQWRNRERNREGWTPVSWEEMGLTASLCPSSNHELKLAYPGMSFGSWESSMPLTRILLCDIIAPKKLVSFMMPRKHKQQSLLLCFNYEISCEFSSMC